MSQNLLIFTIALPLALGILLASVACFSNRRSPLLTILAAIACLGIYLGLEGLPPFPPVSSKHKLPYLIALIGLIGLVASRSRGNPGPVVTFGALFACFVWIAYRKLSKGVFEPELVLALAPIIAASFVSRAPEVQKGDPFLWPVTLLSIAFSGALVALLGGYIGLGQLLGAHAALLGGYVLVMFIMVSLLQRPVSALGQSGVIWVITSVISIFLISTAVFASKLNPLAFLLVCLLVLTPIISARFLSISAKGRPFAIAGCAVLPALVSVGIAYINPLVF